MEKRNIVKVIFIAILSIITLILFSNLDNGSNYINFDYEIESITYEDNDLYLTFIGDESIKQREDGISILYVIYEHDVDLSLLDELSVGDNVNITVKDNYGKVKYAIIYEMEYKGETLFSIIEDYSASEHNNKLIFISFFLSIIGYLIFLCFYHEKERENKTTDFIIKNPLWAKYFFIGFIVGSLGVILSFTILYLLNLCDFDYFVFNFVFYFFLLLGIFGVYVCVKEKFIFQNQVFSYHKIFGKTRSVKVSQIKIILVKPNDNGIISKVEFYDHNDNKVFWFLDDGTSFKDNFFLTACDKYDIPISIVSKNMFSKKVKKAKYDMTSFIEYLTVLTSGNYNLKITITTEENNIILLKCNYGYLELLANGKENEISVEDVTKYIDFSKPLTVEADIDFTVPIENQIVIIKNELWFKPNLI
jgi:hypothetical protein